MATPPGISGIRYPLDKTMLSIIAHDQEMPLKRLSEILEIESKTYTASTGAIVVAAGFFGLPTELLLDESKLFKEFSGIASYRLALAACAKDLTTEDLSDTGSQQWSWYRFFKNPTNAVFSLQEVSRACARAGMPISHLFETYRQKYPVDENLLNEITHKIYMLRERDIGVLLGLAALMMQRADDTSLLRTFERLLQWRRGE